MLWRPNLRCHRALLSTAVIEVARRDAIKLNRAGFTHWRRGTPVSTGGWVVDVGQHVAGMTSISTWSLLVDNVHGVTDPVHVLHDGRSSARSGIDEEHNGNPIRLQRTRQQHSVIGAAACRRES
jgi:hypothetical protein